MLLADRLAARATAILGELRARVPEQESVLEWLHGQRDFGAIRGHYLYPSGFLAVLAARGFGRLTWTLQHAGVVTPVSHELARKISLLVDRPVGVAVIANAVDRDTFSPGPPDPVLRMALGIAPGELAEGILELLGSRLLTLVATYVTIRTG